MENKTTLAAAIAFGIITPGAANAALVYEPFEGYTAGQSIVGKAPNSNTVGLNTGTNYAGTSGATDTVVSSGLTFGSLTTSGGALQSSNTSGAAKTRSAKLALSSPFTGTLYQSYLVNFASTMGSANSIYSFISLDDDGTISGTANNSYFQTYADTPTGSTNALPAIAYGPTTTTRTNAGTTLATNTTYLLLARYTNVGKALSASTTGVGTIYALTLAQFNNFKAGGLTDSELDGATTGTGSANVLARVSSSAATSGTFTFATDRWFGITDFGTSGNPMPVTYDEIRYGTSLDDVTPVPEPAALSLLALAVPAVLRRRRSA